jgi:eukaryotic-like serine/threonine-protein kinase
VICLNMLNEVLMTIEFTLSDQPTSLPETITRSGADLFAEDEQEILLEDVAFSSSFSEESRYQLRNELNRGGMGVVISAYDTLLKRVVAIKLLRRKYRDQPNIKAQFIEEALLTSSLQHPSIVPIYDRGNAPDKRPFFVMKLVSGVALSTLLVDSSSRQRDRLQLLRAFEQICQTVSYAHSRGILHLDIKPANIMIGDFGEVLLMDWGQAKWWKPMLQSNLQLETDRLLNPAQETFRDPVGTGGTPAYMSPEQACGKRVSPASDIFSLGSLLCEILVGRPTYKASNPQSLLMFAKQGNTLDALSEMESSGSDNQLITIAKQCLAKKPEMRPTDAQVVADAIGIYLETAVEQAESDRCRFFDLTLDMFCIATLQGYFVRLNANFNRVLGYSEHELLSQPFLNFVHPADRPDTLEVMKGLLQGKPVIQFCNRYRHAYGHYLILEWTAQSLPKEGHIFAVARDVTNRPMPHFSV